MNEETRKKLDEAIPQEAIEQRSGGGAKMLSYLSGAYVINRLNQVIGQGRWGYEIEKLDKVFEGEIEQYSGKAFTVSYIAQVRLYTSKEDSSPWGSGSFTEVGYGDGTDKKSPGKAHELATKEAVTDALKRAAKNLGISMGLGLYFKEGQYVGEEKAVDNIDATTRPGISERIANAAIGEAKLPATPADASMGRASAAGGGAPTKASEKVLKGQIKSAFAVLQDQKKISKETFVSDYLKGKKVDDLDDKGIQLVITKLGLNFPELGLGSTKGAN